MKGKKPDHWLLENIPQSVYDSVLEFADMRLVHDSFSNSFCMDGNTFSEEKYGTLLNVINMLELSLLDVVDNSQLFNEICQDLFHLTLAIPFPTDELNKIKYVYKIISYAYLGQKWESGRRFIIEYEKICTVDVHEHDSWDVKVFKKIYMAFFHLIRKNDWQDLSKASEYIVSLRTEQNIFEKSYLNSLEPNTLKTGAYELFSLYHFAKAIDLITQFMISGKPSDIRHQIDFHFEKAISAADQSINVEMSLLLNIILLTFKQMLSNSIWLVTERVNSRVTKFVNSITSSSSPVFELMYPQRLAILEKGLLDPAHKAIVVNMPTSSGKTLLAEFRILQALNQFADDGGWVAYIAPNRSLVNQVTARLRRDFSPINICVEKMSGAIELNSFEEGLLVNPTRRFDVIVTTPEKMNLLIRESIEQTIGRPLALAVIDEAHNIEDDKRGINLELLMANIKNDCPKSNFLLLTPFIPNSKQVSTWLDPDSPNDISMELFWTPNDRIIGAFYPEGKRRSWNTYFQTIITENERIKIQKKLLINSTTPPIDVAYSKLNKKVLTMSVAKQLIDRNGLLVICRTIKDCWDLANALSDEIEDTNVDQDIELVKRFLAAELGDNFILLSLLNKRIGVHHAGLPDEIRYLMEWLMENNKLKVLVATTTIAQGINFPVSTVLMASYSYPFKNMPSRDFWNLAGRAGRTNHSSIGLIGIAANPKPSEKQKDLNFIKEFVNKSTSTLVSNMITMVEKALQLSENLNLASLFYDPQWSQFLQYITHMFNQCSDLGEFNTKAELFLRRTFGYQFIDSEKKAILLNAVQRYGQKLSKNSGLASLSDSTGFSMEAISLALNRVKDLGIKRDSFKSPNLFSNATDLKNIIGVMLTIPEIKENLEQIKVGEKSLDGNTLSKLTSDWVSGVGIEDIANKYFNGNNEENVTQCCRAIFSKLINSATWGLSSLQKLTIDFDKLSDEDKRYINNLPAMIYYGVSTEEAILMRMNNVPRGLAPKLGQTFKSSNKVYHASSLEVSTWLNNLPETEWHNNISKGKNITGKEYKQIWQILNGEI